MYNNMSPCSAPHRLIKYYLQLEKTQNMRELSAAARPWTHWGPASTSKHGAPGLSDVTILRPTSGAPEASCWAGLGVTCSLSNQRKGIR
ncbi:hypothetical protein GDO81_021236 [Engystomops pustulosus]|uniref:Uncharacterized protein n=1 Tax=Engystomops pustulosus TaxID=76066 RepID=A0AAV6ZD51_ENGPU|nr:hypothetical protein GDO81_021236 [Engystomops pustulosus]